MTRDCRAPIATPAAPAFPVPADSCDSHVHVFGPYDRFPLAADRSYTPPEQRAEDFIRLIDALRFRRGVLVTASAHGAENGPVLEALRRFPERLRGVAVLAPDVTDAALDAMTASGVRGVRVNLFRREGKPVYRNGMGLDALRTLAPRLRERGWHLQAWLHAPDLPKLWPELRTLGMEVVIDHMGRMSTAGGVGQPGFRLLCDLLRDGAAWTKLSGADRLTTQGAPYHDVDAFAAALLAANPERAVWGSDWPHVAYFDASPPDDGALLNALGRWTAFDPGLRRKVLAENPARLYGFPLPA